MLSLIVPTFGGNIENIKRTIDSFKGISDDLVIIHAKLFDEDTEELRSLTDSVVVTDWNLMFKGFSVWMNSANHRTQNDWMCLMGVGETFESAYPALDFYTDKDRKAMMRIDHEGDPNQWKRIWHRYSGVHWSGLIHESLVGGFDGPLLFRMRDTEKVPHKDPFKNQVLKFMKACSYNWNYFRLQQDHSLLGGTDPGWLKFVDGSKDTIHSWIETHRPMVNAAISGDREEFLNQVRIAMDEGREPTHVNHNPLGQPMSEGA